MTGNARERLLKLSREQNTLSWFQQHGGQLPKQVQTLADHEDRAVAISQFQSTLIPGLLQTGDYARALFKEAGRVPSAEIDDRVGARLARQNLFSRERPPKFVFFIHEFALYMPVGGARVMSDQLHSLLRVAVRPILTLRIVPAAIGAHSATGGPFTLLEFAEFGPVAYLDSETSSLFLEEPEEIAAYRGVLAALEGTALDERESRELIATVATGLYSNREDHDGRT